MTAPQNPRVTQADREAAKSLLGRDDAGPSWWSIDSGNADNDPMVQAFARHREAAEAEVKAREAALAEALAWFVGGDCPACKGWGEVAYFGEMVACKCNGQYLPTPSHEQVRRARIALAALKEIEQ